MAKILKIHSQNPQLRIVRQVVSALRSGSIIAYPTDSGYALGCTLGNKNALDRIRKIRNLDKHHHFTLMMRDLSHISEYAKLDNSSFRLLKNILPGAYTFILVGSRDVPSRLLHTKKKTIGIRISEHAVVQSLLTELSEPMMSVSLILEKYDLFSVEDVINILDKKVDIIIDSGYCPLEPTTVIDCTSSVIEVARYGAGKVDFL